METKYGPAVFIRGECARQAIRDLPRVGMFATLAPCPVEKWGISPLIVVWPVEHLNGVRRLA